jgi:hypothetical protein
MQGKGGVGKSFVASTLLQYFTEEQVNARGIDADAANNTLGSYRELDVVVLPLVAEGNRIEPTEFDRIADAASAMAEDGHLVIDTGASAYRQLCQYLLDVNAFGSEGVYRECGHSIVIHTVVAGGGGLSDSLDGLSDIIFNFKSFPIYEGEPTDDVPVLTFERGAEKYLRRLLSDIPLVVWLNPKDGKIQIEGKNFFDFSIYQHFGSAIDAVVTLPVHDAATFGKDLSAMLTRRETFDAAINSSSRPIMTRHRLKRYWTEIRAELALANVISLGAMQ